VCLDSTTIKAHHTAPGALKKRPTGHQSFAGRHQHQEIHLVAADARGTLSLALSSGPSGDAPQGREWLRAGGPAPAGCPLIMDRAYEGDETLQLARELGYVPVMPANPNRLAPWECDRVLYRRRNEIERLFRRFKGYRRIFTRFDKLDVLFAGFLLLALIIEALR
jgi:transposase